MLKVSELTSQYFQRCVQAIHYSLALKQIILQRYEGRLLAAQSWQLSLSNLKNIVR